MNKTGNNHRSTRKRRSIMQPFWLWCCVIVVAATRYYVVPVDAAPRGSSHWKDPEGSSSKKTTTTTRIEEKEGDRVRGRSRGRNLASRVRLGAGMGGAAGLATTKGRQMKDPISPIPPRLPFPLSDHTSTVWNGLVYIAGGCNSPDGNKYIEANQFFACNSISDAFFTFDPSRFVDHFTTLPNLPRPRYRHSCTTLKDQVWLIGGRDINDNLISIIDVYDIPTSQWLNVDLSGNFQVSDHATFQLGDYIYIAGGYDAVYTPQNLVYRIDTSTFTSTGGSVKFEQVSSMQYARGDISATQTSSGLVYVTGGLDSTFCEAVNFVEEFFIPSGTWTTVSNLNTPRYDVAMVELADFIFVLGGEAPSPNECTTSGNVNLGDTFVPVTTTEVRGQNDEWIELGTLDVHKYKFSTFAWDATKTIYTVGGQDAYDEQCQCYRTSDIITANRRLFAEAENAVAPPPTPPPVANPTNTPTQDIPVVVGNDLCINAPELPIVSFGVPQSKVTYGNTESATVKNVEPCGPNVESDQPGVWFRVRGSGGQLTALTCHEFTNFDTKLSVYSGSCGNLQCVAANDDGCPGTSTKSRVIWNSQTGATYYILVHGWVTNPVGNYGISVRAREPVNDDCLEAQGPLEVGDRIEGTTIYAQLDFGGSGAAGQTCGGAYGNVEGAWYTTIGTGGTMTADTCDIRTDYDSKLHIFEGSCGGNSGGGLSCVAGNDNNYLACGNSLTDRRSSVSWESEAGKLYHIFVHGFQNNPRGFYVLAIT